MPILLSDPWKWVLAILVCVVLPLSAGRPANAQGHGLEVRAVEHELYSFEPRQTVTLAFRVRNGTGADVQLDPSLILPQGWRTITSPLPFSLAAGESTVTFVSFLIPEGAAAGDHTVGYAVQQRFQPAVRAASTVVVRVLPVWKLHVSPQEAPDAVPSGGEYRAQFVLRNGGNAPLAVDFKMSSSLGHTVVPDAGRMVLAAGETRNVSVLVKTEISRQRALDVLMLEASANDAKITERASRAITLLPRMTRLEPYRTVPAALTFRYLTEDGSGGRRSGWQTELSGQGALDEAGVQRIGFLFRGPDRQGVNAFGMLDEYRLDYSGKNGTLGLGDRAYSLSPLTESGRYGRGIRGTYRTRNGDLTFYRMEDRFGLQRDKQNGLGFGLAFSDKSRLDLNYLSKSGAVAGEILGLRAQQNEGRLFVADGEVAYGLSDNDTAVHGRVYDGRHPFRYNANLLWAPPDFPGYYRDQAWLTGGFDYPSAPRWTTRGYAAWQRSNLARAAGRNASDERWLTLGADYLLTPGNRLTIDYTGRRTTDLQPQPTADARHHAFRLGAIQQLGALSVNVSVERGRTENKLQGQRFPTTLYLLAAGWQATDGQLYSIHLSRDDNVYSTARQRPQTSAGLGANYRFSDRTSLFLYLQATFAQQNNTSHNLSFQHRFGSGHQLEAMVRRSSGTLSQTDAMISYTIPLDLPVARKKNVASVRGRLFDAERGVGVSGAALDLGGLVAVTDAQGRFSYPAVGFGKQYLSLLQADAVSGMVPVRPLPIEIEVREGADNEVEVAMVRAGTLAGQVTVYEPNGRLLGQWLAPQGAQASPNHEQDSGRLAPVRGLAGVLVTLRNGEREVRRLTDASGRFRVSGLPAGTWSASIEDGGEIPSGYALAQKEIVVEVRPDEEAMVEFRAEPRPRKLQMLPSLSPAEMGG